MFDAGDIFEGGHVVEDLVDARGVGGGFNSALGAEDDIGGAPGFGGELGFEDIDGLLGFGAGDFEAIDEAAADSLVGEGDRDKDDEPGTDDGQGMAMGEEGPAAEEGTVRGGRRHGWSLSQVGVAWKRNLGSVILWGMAKPAVKKPGVKRPTRKDAVANRERVLVAAREVFREQGLEAEMREIAARAGVGVGTVYRNFPSKEALVDGLVLQFQSEMQPHLEIAAGIAPADEAVKYLLNEALRRVEEYGEVLGLLVTARPETVQRAKGELLGGVVAIFERGVKEGVIRNDLAPEFMAMFLHASMPEMYQRLRLVWSAEEVAEGLLVMMLRALSPAG